MVIENGIDYSDKMFVCNKCKKYKKCKDSSRHFQWCWEFERKGNDQKSINVSKLDNQKTQLN